MTRIILPWLAALLGLGVLLPLAVEAQSHPLRHIVVVGTVASDGRCTGSSRSPGWRSMRPANWLPQGRWRALQGPR